VSEEAKLDNHDVNEGNGKGGGGGDDHRHEPPDHNHEEPGHIHRPRPTHGIQWQPRWQPQRR
jgi:hypothetical protein